MKFAELKPQQPSSSSESFRSQRTNNEDDDDDIMVEVRKMLKDKRENKQDLNSKEKKLLLKTKQQLLESKEQLLVSQEDDYKKRRRSHLQEQKYPARISPFVSNDLEHCDEEVRRCVDCFGIEKKNEYQNVDHNLMVVGALS